MPFCFQGALITKLEAIECDVNQVFVEQEMLTLLVSKDNHECLNEGVSQMRVNQLIVIRANVSHAHLLYLLCVFVLGIRR
jgi:hypothetical protein